MSKAISKLLTSWIECIRKARNSDDTEWKIIMFVISVLMLIMFGLVVFLFARLLYDFPRATLSITATLWGLWLLYNKI